MLSNVLRPSAKTALATTAMLLVGLAGAAPAAHADSVTVRDGRDTTMDADITRVRVGHADTLVVRVHLDRVRRTDRRVLQGMNVYVDLRRRHAGPELLVESGLWRAADHVVTRADRWHRAGLLDCRSSLRRDLARDVVVLRLGRDCLPARHPRARVAVVTSERRANDEARWTSDWMTDRRTFGPWVPRG